jgi:hypothetical protein
VRRQFTNIVFELFNVGAAFARLGQVMGDEIRGMGVVERHGFAHVLKSLSNS